MASASASLSSAGLKPRARSRGDDGGLVGIALAGDVPLDRADGHALVCDAMVIAPCRQDREPAAKSVCRVDPGMPANLLVDHKVNAAGLVLDLGQPVLEAQEAHAAALPAVEPELRRAAGDGAVGAAQREAGGGAEIEGEQNIPARIRRSENRGCDRRCRRIGRDVHHEGSRNVGLRLWSKKNYGGWGRGSSESIASATLPEG